MKVVKPFITILSLLLVFTSAAKDKSSLQSEKKKAEIQQAIQSHFAKSQAAFELNQGQFNADLLYRYGSPRANVDFYQDRLVFSMRKMTKQLELTRPDGLPEFDYVVWEIQLNSSDAELIHEKEEVIQGVNYFDGSENARQKAISSRITYKGLYPNIDMVFYEDERGALKYDFILHPGAKISDIALEYIGVEGLSLLDDGRLSYSTKWGDIEEEKPFSYLVENKQEIRIDYLLDGNTLKFDSELDEVNTTIILDPIYVDWSTYFYGSGNNGFSWAWTWVLDLDIDDSNNVYVTGMTNDKFPIYTNAYDTTPAGFYDAFVCKMSESGDSILWFSYIGGSSYEYSFTLTVNSAHQPVIAGFSWSTDFPTTVGAYDRNATTFSVYKGFVTKFSDKGDKLIYSTFLGGSGNDLLHSLALDAQGNVYITGETRSSDFPTTAGCYDATYGGASGGGWWTGGDAFLTKLNPNGTDLVFSTFIGGAKDDVGYDIQLSPAGDIYIVGKTASGNFPNTPGASIFNYNVKGASDGFIMKFKPDGKTLSYSKLMGGDGADWFESVYINDYDEAYVAGISESNNFYTTTNAYQKSSKGGADMVVVKMNSLGQNVYYSTYVGGSGDEKYWSGWIYNSNVSISANVREEAIICGISRSNDFPITSDALYSSNPSASGGGWWNTSATISKLDYLGKSLLYGTYYGGSSYEIPGANKLRRISCYTNILYGGVTASADYPTTSGVYRENKSTSTTGFFWTGFISKFRDTLYTDLIELSIEDTIYECDQVFEIMDAKNQGADILWNDGWTNRFKILKDTGQYWVQATYGCDTVRDTIQVMLEYSPSMPVLPADSFICDVFNNIELDAKHDTILASYAWNTGDTGQKITATQPDKYWVTISTPHCGTETDSITFTMRYSPDIQLPADTTYCDSFSVLLASGLIDNDEIYRWNTGDSTSSILVDSVGLYTLVASNMCASDSDQVQLDLRLTPQVNMGLDSVFCDAVDITLYSAADSGNDESFQWLDLNNSVVLGTADSFRFTSPGHYALRSTNICAAIEDSIVLDLLYSPTVDLGPDSIYCDQLSYLLNIGLIDNEEEYLWDDGTDNAYRFFSTEGKYWVQVSNRCALVSDTLEFTERITPVADIQNPMIGDVTDSVFCDVVNMVLDANTGQPDVSYLWNTGSSQASITADKSGWYKVSLTGHCGTARDSVELGIIYSPSLDLGQDKVFCGAVEVFDISVGQADNQESYLWKGGSTASSYTVDQVGDHWVQISNKCASVSDTINIRVSPYLVVDLGPDTTLCGDFSVELNAGNPGMSYLWEPYGETTQIIEANEQRIYTVHVTNQDNCTSSDDFEVKPDCISYTHIPNAFTPNRDGNNDVFKPVLINYQDYQLRIFNRWGELVFESYNPDLGWDGTYKGSDVQQGIYLYEISLTTTEDLKSRQFKGLIHLIR